MLIIRRLNYINTASGTVLSVSDRQVCRLRRSWFLLNIHVSSNAVLIIRRLNCINTASGIVRCVSDCPVCRLRRNWFLLNVRVSSNTSSSSGGL